MNRSLRMLVLSGVGLLLLECLPACSRPVYVRPAPPPPLVVKVKPRRPHKRAVWVTGHWRWHGPRKGYVWVKGRWKIVRH